MKKKTIASLTMAGLMALQVPMTAFAAGTWYIDGDKTGNVIVDDACIGATFNDENNISATLDGYIKMDYAGALTSKAIVNDGTSNSLHITGKDSNGDSVIMTSNITGTASSEASGAIDADGSGTIVIDGNIRVTETGTPAAVGGIATANTGASVTAGDVSVTYGNTAGNTNAIGIYSVKGKVTVGDVYVTNNGVYGNSVNKAAAYGISTTGGTTTTGDLTVTGNEDAVGIYTKENEEVINITTGDIRVETKKEAYKCDAVGIAIGDNAADVTVKAEKITVTSDNSDSSTGAISTRNPGANKVNIECTGVEINADESGSLLLSWTGDEQSENDIRINGAVTGDIEYGMQIYTINGKNSVTVDSDLKTSVIGIILECEDGMTDIAVNGTLSGDMMAIGVEEEAMDPALYNISVYGLATSETGVLSNSESVLANVNYIVHGNDGAADYKNMTFDPAQVETVTVNGKTYYTAKEGTITVTVNNGYALKSTQALSGSGNTYTVTIPQGGFVTLETILAAVENEESGDDSSQKPVTTGSIGAPVMNGIWNMAPDGAWSYRTNALFRSTWAYIGNPYAKEGQAKEGWFYFDENGVMLTGWQKLDGKWYYFNREKDGTQGQMLVNTTTPDGYRVGADGVLAD